MGADFSPDLAAPCVVLSLFSAVLDYDLTSQPRVGQMAESGLFFGDLTLLKMPLEMSESEDFGKSFEHPGWMLVL